MTPKALLLTAIDPALVFLQSHGVKSDDRARVLVLAIAGQESAWEYRRQLGGPARSFWQFEKGGGVAEVFQKAPSVLRAVCDELFVPFDQTTCFEAMCWNDFLAAAMARLLLWPDPAPLPEVGDVDGGWRYYEKNWRPGAPHPAAWPARYATALGLIRP